MSYRKLACGVFAALLGAMAPSAAREMPALKTAPAGGQLLSSSLVRLVVPEGWNWTQSGSGALTASPNVPPGFFKLEDPRLTDDMATCIDLSRNQDQAGLSQKTLSESVARIHARTTTKINAVSDVPARAVSFAELRNIGGGARMMVAIIPDDVSQFGAEFTGDIYTETPKATVHLVCKAVFSSDKGPYAEREAMKALLQLLNSFTPL